MWQGSQLLRLSQMTGAACRRRYSCTRARTRFLHEPNVTLVLYRCSPGACVASSKAVAKAQMKTHRRGRAMKLATSEAATSPPTGLTVPSRRPLRSASRPPTCTSRNRRLDHVGDLDQPLSLKRAVTRCHMYAMSSVGKDASGLVKVGWHLHLMLAFGIVWN